MSPATDARVSSATIGAVRIVAGVLWLANLEWKRPPDFGRTLGNGLYKYVAGEVRHPVLGPYDWVVRHVVLRHYTLFGWITLLAEVTVAALLMLGWKTRIVALVAAVMSLNIMLTVLYYDKSYEWPWSYYLMIAIHLLLFAVAAGRHIGLDGAVAAGGRAVSRAVTVLGAVAVAVGVCGLIAAHGVSFSAKQGALLGWAKGELKILWFNPLAALITIALGVVALLGIRLAQRPLVLAAAAGFALMALQVLVQWRYNGGLWTGGILGGTGGNLALWAMFAIGFFVCFRRLGSPAAPAAAQGATTEAPSTR